MAVLILLLCLVHILYIIVAYKYLFLMFKTQLHLYKSTNSVTSTFNINLRGTYHNV